MFRKMIFSLFGALSSLMLVTPALSAERPDTGISGVFEVMVGVRDLEAGAAYFREFGFVEVDSASLSRAEALEVYGVESALTSVRMQNGATATHGLVRLLYWESPLSDGVGFAPPMTLGQRLSVMRTRDIFRLDDIFRDAKFTGEPWLVVEPVFDDLYAGTEGRLDFFNRRVGVRESSIYGSWFNHVFFQRYGYTIPGYGMIHDDSPLQTSEFTHHDFVIGGDIDEATAHYETVLGFKREAEPVVNGSWQRGPQRIFQLEPGTSHWYVGFVSPNNVAGKLKFFVPRDPRGDRRCLALPGHLGMTIYSLYTPRIELVHELASRHGLSPTRVRENEFGEDSFLFIGPDGVAWQVLRDDGQRGLPVDVFRIQPVGN